MGSKTLKGDAIEGFQRTLKGAPDLTRALAPAARAAQGTTRTELEGTIQGLSRTVDEVAEKEADLVPLAQRTTATAAALTVDGAQPLDATLAVLPDALRELRETAPVATDLVDRLDRLAVAITPALPNLALAARDTVPVLERAIPVLRRSTPLIRDTRQLATRLGKAKSGLLQMFELLPAPLKRFGEAFDVINSTTVHGAPAYRQLLAAFVGFDGIFSGYQTQAQNPMSPGHALRISTYFSPDAFDGVVLPRDAAGSVQSEDQTVDCSDVDECFGARRARARGSGVLRVSALRNIATLPARFVRSAWRFADPKLKVGRIPFARTALLIQLAAAVLFIGYTLTKKDTQLPFSDDPYEVQVMLADAQGLNPVKEPAAGIAGVNSGKVIDAEVAPNGQALVTLRFDSDMRGQDLRGRDRVRSPDERPADPDRERRSRQPRRWPAPGRRGDRCRKHAVLGEHR